MHHDMGCDPARPSHPSLVVHCSPNVTSEVIWSCNRRRPYVMLYALEVIEKDDE